MKLNNSSLYVKGTADMWAHDVKTGDLIGYTNKIDSSKLSTSCNAGEIRAGIGAPVVINIPDSSAFKGEVTAADFSLEARQLATGGTLRYNGTVPFRENIVAKDSKLVVSRKPVSAYGESVDNEYYSCYVGNDGKNYGVDPKSREIQGFVAEEGKTYCVLYYVEVASAQELSIPTTFSPVVARVMVKMAVYQAQGNSDKNSSLAGYLYAFIPRAQFIDGDAGVDGSQTTNANTTWSFSALAYDETDTECSECAKDQSVFGYMVYVPCGDTTQAVKDLIVMRGKVVVKVGGKVQTPVYYVMPDNSIVTPDYSDLVFAIKQATAAVNADGEEEPAPVPATEIAKVDEDGVVTGVTVGETEMNITLSANESVSAVCKVVVQAG